MSSTYSRFILLALVAWLVTACSSLGIESKEQKQKQAKVEVSWPYAKEGVLIELFSSSDLNLHAGRPHTLVLAIVQLEDDKAFPKLLANNAALEGLLYSGKLAAGVLHVDRFVINPGELHVVPIDRVQDTKFVGLVAGYYEFNAAQAARLFRIPLNIQSSGLILKDYKADPAVLALRIALGSQRIVNVVSLTHDPDKVPNKEMLPLSGAPSEIPLSVEAPQRPGPYQGPLIKLGP